jgi:hypothetical protein
MAAWIHRGFMTARKRFSHIRRISAEIKQRIHQGGERNSNNNPTNNTHPDRDIPGSSCPGCLGVFGYQQSLPEPTRFSRDGSSYTIVNPCSGTADDRVDLCFRWFPRFAGYRIGTRFINRVLSAGNRQRDHQQLRIFDCIPRIANQYPIFSVSHGCEISRAPRHSGNSEEILVFSPVCLYGGMRKSA